MFEPVGFRVFTVFHQRFGNTNRAWMVKRNAAIFDELVLFGIKNGHFSVPTGAGVLLSIVQPHKILHLKR